MTDTSESPALRRPLEDIRQNEARLRVQNAALESRVAELTKALSEEQTSTKVAREAAETAIRMKDDALASMSHEIRTPVNGVLGMLELALDTVLTPAQRDHITTARASAFSLLEVIDDILDAQPAALSTLAAPASGGMRSLRVLVAEDNLVNQKVARGFLEREGHRVVIAENGQLAADAAAQSDFDLILMDVQMPVLGGFDATRLIRDWESRVGGHVTIVALTALARPGDREACLAAGMDGYLSKPLRADALAAAIDELVMPGHRNGPKPEMPASASDDVFDEAAILEVLGGDRELLVEIIATFLGEAPKQMAAMWMATKVGDPDMLLEAAHSMKGAAATITANDVAAITRQLESMGRAGDSGAARQLSELEAALTTLRERVSTVRVQERA
jgi:CheY-like chemotaxis protein/HPt (histidine-containing phosphotransfer) domain-containing protein